MSLPNLSDLKQRSQLSQLIGVPSKNGKDRYFYIGHYAGKGSSPTSEEKFKSYVENGGGPVTFEWRRKFQTTRDKEETEQRMQNLGIDMNVTQFMRRFIKQQQGRFIDKGMNGLLTWWWLNTRSGADVLDDAGECQFIYRVPEKWLQEFATKCLEYVFLTSEDAIQQSKRDYRYIPWAFLTAIPVPIEYRITTSDPLDHEDDRRMSNLEVADIVYQKHIESDTKSRSAQHYNALIQAADREMEKESERRSKEAQILRRQRPELFNPF